MSNELGDRYCSTTMRQQWDPITKAVIERQLWVAALEAQQTEGIEVAAEDLARYKSAISDIDMGSIHSQEQRTKHETAARLAEFNRVANAEGIHQAMTSCDISDNTTQVQVLRSAAVIRQRSAEWITALADAAYLHRDTRCIGVTHNQPAQPTTWGRRLAMWLEEAVLHHRAFISTLDLYPIRGLVGAVGTSRDMVVLFQDNGGDDPITSAWRVNELFTAQMRHIISGGAQDEGMATSAMPRLHASGQNYLRSADTMLGRAGLSLLAAPCSFAVTGRLMAGNGLLTEVYDAERVGSSAMPHKINPSKMERVSSLAALADGYLHSFDQASRARWYEGDVADSAARRVGLPGFWQSTEATLLAATDLVIRSVLDEFSAAAEVEWHAQRLMSGSLLSAMLKRGYSRVEAHDLLREVYRSNGADPVTRVADLLQIDEQEIDSFVSRGVELVPGQVEFVVADARRLLEEEAGRGVYPVEVSGMAGV